MLALLDTLEYLKKGGLISKATAFAGSMLNIKPVITLSNGEVSLVSIPQGLQTWKQSLARVDY